MYGSFYLFGKRYVGWLGFMTVGYLTPTLVLSLSFSLSLSLSLSLNIYIYNLLINSL